jgi:xanthine dehydrogenase small subunit
VARNAAAGRSGKRGDRVSRTPMSELDLRRASSLGDALTILRDEKRTPIAGATDLYVAAQFGTLVPRKLLDIWEVKELRGISLKGDTLVIGALATYTSLIRSPEINKRLPMLIEASQQVGGPQIQNRGTVGGNIANGSPAGDSLPVWAATDATVVLRSASGERRVKFNEFYTGYRATVMKPDELIIAVEVPPVEGKQWFRKVGTRRAQAISKIVVAGVRSAAPKIAFGSLAATVVRVPKTEAALAKSGIDEAAKVLAGEISPIDDVRSSAEYRKQVAVNLLRRFWTETA